MNIEYILYNSNILYEYRILSICMYVNDRVYIGFYVPNQKM